jgi:four helix bundle protein
LPNSVSVRIITFQLGKAASSVGANYRAFCRGRSFKEKYAKICIVVEEADEVEFWLLNLQALNFGDKEELVSLLNESLELIKVTSKLKSSLRQ